MDTKIEGAAGRHGLANIYRHRIAISGAILRGNSITLRTGKVADGAGCGRSHGTVRNRVVGGETGHIRPIRYCNADVGTGDSGGSQCAEIKGENVLGRAHGRDDNLLQRRGGAGGVRTIAGILGCDTISSDRQTTGGKIGLE